MNVTFSETVKRSGDYAQLARDTEYLKRIVDRGEKDLETFVGPSAAAVAAHWDCLPDERGYPQYVLKLSGFSQEVSDTFSPNDLRPDIRFPLVRLWSNLVGALSDARMKKLRDLVQQGISSAEANEH